MSHVDIKNQLFEIAVRLALSVRGAKTVSARAALMLSLIHI